MLLHGMPGHVGVPMDEGGHAGVVTHHTRECAYANDCRC
jgi:hypothetical protein